MKPLKQLHIRFAKLTLVVLITGLSGMALLAQTKVDSHSGQAALIRIDTQPGLSKGDNDAGQGNTNTVVANENVSFTGTSEGIYINITSGINKIKLYALTGQLLLDGDLGQGRFIIQTRKGIYFIRVNNKPYKVICR